MSRIFDALQRSEGERSRDQSATLPEGPELLQHAERRAVSDWEAAAPPHGRETDEVVDGHDTLGPAASSSNPPMPGSPASQPWSREKRMALLSQVHSLPVSLEPESRLVCLTDRESPTAEALRLLSVRLRDLRAVRPLKKVLITSSIPREGKSTIAANLACALAHGSEEKILLIEGDLRLPAMRQMFGVERIPGISELVQDGLHLKDCLCRLDGAGVWILAAGRVPANPLEVLQSPKLPEVMQQLAGCFDWIIIDSPPVLPLADTSVWMRAVDGILLVTRQGVTEKQQLRRGLEALEPQKVLGALLNSVVGSAYSSYYYYRKAAES